jgi:hypothetical protein
MKRLTSALLCFVLVLSSALCPATAADSQKSPVLVLFQQDGSEDTATQIKEVIRQIITSDHSCDVVPTSAYSVGLLQKYKFVVAVDLSDARLAQELRTYAGNLCWIGSGFSAVAKSWKISDAGTVSTQRIDCSFGKLQEPAIFPRAVPIETFRPQKQMQIFASVGSKAIAFQSASVCCLSCINGLSDNIRLRALLYQVLSAFFGTKDFPSAISLDLSYVYPISDFSLCAKMGQHLQQKHLPFYFTVMPFYQSSDNAPAASYENLLQYLNSCGGTALLHIPVFQAMAANSVPDFAQLSRHMETAIRSYSFLKTYPVALQMPEDTLFYPSCNALLKQSSPVFLVNGSGKAIHTLSQGTIASVLPSKLVTYQSGTGAVWELRAPDSEKKYPEFYKDVQFAAKSNIGNWFITLPSDMDYTKFQKLVDGIAENGLPLSNSTQKDYHLEVGKQQVSSLHGAVTYNGSRIDSNVNLTSSTPATSSNTETKSKNIGSTIFLIGGCGVLLVLLVAVLINLKANQNKFLKRKK